MCNEKCKKVCVIVKKNQSKSIVQYAFCDFKRELMKSKNEINMVRMDQGVHFILILVLLEIMIRLFDTWIWKLHIIMNEHSDLSWFYHHYKIFLVIVLKSRPKTIKVLFFTFYIVKDFIENRTKMKRKIFLFWKPFLKNANKLQFVCQIMLLKLEKYVAHKNV